MNVLVSLEAGAYAVLTMFDRYTSGITNFQIWFKTKPLIPSDQKRTS